MRKIITTLLIILSTACVNQQQNSESMQQSDNVIDASRPTDNKTLKFSKQCANQYCNSYDVSITDNSYIYKNNGGTSVGQISPRQSKKVNQMIDSLKLRALKTDILPGGRDCLEHSSDASSYFLTVQKGTFSQTLHIYRGCQNIPKVYLQLIDGIERMFMSLAES